MIEEKKSTSVISEMRGRNVSLDLLRIITMLMIVMGHCLLHGGVIEAVTGTNSANYYITKTIYAFLLVHVNCFVLASGYFLCEGTFKVKKVLTLWGSAFFWSVLLYAILCGTGAAGFSLQGVVKAVLPFTQQRYWFLTNYLLMYILSPYMNILIRAMNRKQHASCIGVFFLVYICLQNLVFWREFTAVNSHDPLFFMFLYMAAAYIRRYPMPKCRWFLGYVICCGFVAFWTIVNPIVTTHVFGREIGDTAFNGYNSIPLVLGAICFFMAFVQMKVKSEWLSKMAVTLAPLTFGVYLIHDHQEMRGFLWKGLLKPYLYADKPYLILLVIGFAVGVFVVCAGLEKMRLYIRKLLKVELVTEKIGSMFSKIFDFGIDKMEKKD